MSNDRHKTISPYPLRMKPELREKLAELGQLENRILHAEIIFRLEESVKPHITSKAVAQTSDDLVAMLLDQARTAVKESLAAPAIDPHVMQLAQALSALPKKKIEALSELLGIILTAKEQVD